MVEKADTIAEYVECVAERLFEQIEGGPVKRLVQVGDDGRRHLGLGGLMRVRDEFLFRSAA